MLRAEKAKVIDDLHAAFNSAGVVVVTHYKGLSVPEVTELRVEMRKAGATFRVAKNRLARRAAEGTPYANVVELFKGPTALAFSNDAVTAAKVATAFAKKNDKLQLVGGGLSGSLLDPAAVRALAELRAKLVGLLQAPAAKLIAVLQAPGAQLARCLNARGEQGSDEGGEQGGSSEPAAASEPVAASEPAAEA